jgi:hypothetical protein
MLKLDRHWDPELRKEDVICASCNLKLTFGRTEDLSAPVPAPEKPFPDLSHDPILNMELPEFDAISSVGLSQYARKDELSAMFSQVRLIMLTWPR